MEGRCKDDPLSSRTPFRHYDQLTFDIQDIEEQKRQKLIMDAVQGSLIGVLAPT